MAKEVVVGVDAGATRTRCAVVSLDGRVVGRGSAAGANRNAGCDPVRSLNAALREALAGVDPLNVHSGVFGMAGSSGAPWARSAADRAWSDLGLGGRPRLCDDIVVAFAAGTDASQGAVLVAGTGAVAARIRGGRVVRRCDGNGWLLGDEGSAVWIALAALRAVLAACEGRGPRTVLSELLAEELDVPPGDPRPLRAAVYARAPTELGALAPAVSRAALDGDTVAHTITDDAAGRLLGNLSFLAPTPHEPVVLAGSVLSAGPVATAVRHGIAERLSLRPVAAGEGALGAAALALREAGRDRAHACLLADAGSVHSGA